MEQTLKDCQKQKSIVLMYPLRDVWATTRESEQVLRHIYTQGFQQTADGQSRKTGNISVWIYKHRKILTNIFFVVSS